jgi:hypothetical protein
VREGAGRAEEGSEGEREREREREREKEREMQRQARMLANLEGRSSGEGGGVARNTNIDVSELSASERAAVHLSAVAPFLSSQ